MEVYKTLRLVQNFNYVLLNRSFNYWNTHSTLVLDKRKISTTSNCQKIIKSILKPIDVPQITVTEYFNNVFTQNKWTDRTAVECFDTGRKISYSELLSRSRFLAANLRNKIGLNDGDSIVTVVPNVIEFPILTLGAIAANCVFSPCNPLYTADEIKKQLINSKAKCIITLDLFLPNVQKAVSQLSTQIPIVLLKLNPKTPIPKGLIDYYELDNANANTDILSKLAKPTLDDTILRPYSSGTTGLPKGVDLTHRNIVTCVEQMKAFGPESYSVKELGVDYPLLEPVVLPFFHIFGLSVIMLGRFAIGHTLIPVLQFTSANFIKLLRQYKPHCLKLVPPIVLMMIASEQITKEDLKNVQFIFTAAAPISAKDIDRLRVKTNPKARITQGYGLTETSGVVAGYTAQLESYDNDSCGTIAANTELRIVDLNTGDDAEVGGSGEILIRGNQVMKGYYNNPQATSETITSDGWLKTGDIGYQGKDHQLYITDRLKELIKVKGFQVAPAELEGLIRSHPDILECAVIGVPNDILGEAPKAFIVTKGGKKLTEKEVKDFVAEKVIEYKQLTGGVVFIDQIPKSQTGKILRRELK